MGTGFIDGAVFMHVCVHRTCVHAVEMGGTSITTGTDTEGLWEEDASLRQLSHNSLIPLCGGSKHQVAVLPE